MLRYTWSDELAVQATAMALANKTLFVAGPPDVIDEEQAAKLLRVPETMQKLAEQEAAFEGKRGSFLVAVSAVDGQQLAAYRLDSAPIFDGLAAASGRLYLSTMDGKVVCCGEGDGPPLQTAADAIVNPRARQTPISRQTRCRQPRPPKPKPARGQASRLRARNKTGTSCSSRPGG